VTILKPLCATCHAQAREPSSARCADCGPGRIVATRPRLRSAERAARALNADETIEDTP
jgi:DNA-directed RNA polymerase subunit RPC12/RpoP